MVTEDNTKIILWQYVIMFSTNFSGCVLMKKIILHPTKSLIDQSKQKSLLSFNEVEKLYYSLSAPLVSGLSPLLLTQQFLSQQNFQFNSMRTSAIINRPAQKVQLFCFRNVFVMAEMSKKRRCSKEVIDLE